MRMEQLKSSLNTNIAPIYLIEGEDAYLRELALKNIQNKVLTNPELNLNIFDGSKAKQKPEEVITALMQYPFMSEKRVVVVRDYLPTASDLKNKAISSYFENPNESSVLVIINSSSCAQLKKINNIEVVDCGKADIATIVRYVQITLKKDNLIITTKNATTLAEYCKMDMARITGEVEKLSAYCSGNSEVTKDDIDLLVNKESDYKIYEFSNNVALKNNAKAYEIMDEMLNDSSDYQKLFSSLYYHFRRLFFLSISAKPTSVLATQFGMNEYAVKKNLEQARLFSPKKLKSIVDMFVRFDSDFKVGKIMISQALTLSMGYIML